MSGRVVVDTMVFAYALLGVEEFKEEAAGAIQAAEEIWVPDSYRAELVNVVWQWIRHRGVAIDTGLGVLHDADLLVTQVVPANLLWEYALHLAVEHGHPAYDTLCVALAISNQCRVVTYDRKLLETFPNYTVTTAEFLGGKS